MMGIPVDALFFSNPIQSRYVALVRPASFSDRCLQHTALSWFKQLLHGI